MTSTSQKDEIHSDDEASAQNPPEDASRAQDRDGRLYLVVLFLVVTVYAVIGYAIYKVIVALA